MKLPPKFYQGYSYHKCLGWSVSPPLQTAAMANEWAQSERKYGMITIIRLVENDPETGLHTSTVDMRCLKAMYLEAAE